MPQWAIEYLKTWMESYHSGKSVEIDDEEKIKALQQAFEELKHDPKYKKQLKPFIDSFLNSNDVDSKSFSFGFDLVLGYDCLVEIFKNYVPSSYPS